MPPPATTAAPATAVPPEVLVICGIGSVQFGAAFADTLFPRAGPAGLVLLRLFFAATVLLAISRPSLRGRTPADLRAAAAFGVTLGALNWSFYEALARLPLGVAVTIEFIGPLILAAAGSRRRSDVAWVVLAGAGVGLLALRGGHQGIHAAGIVLVLFASGCWVCYILLSKRVGAAFARLDGLAIALAVGTVVVLPAGLVQGGSALVAPAVVGGGFAVAMLSSLIPYSLEIMALRRLKASRFGLLMSLQPAVAALAGVIVLHEPLTSVLLIAIAMVVTASVGTSLSVRRAAKPLPEA